jgi:hypothetical protein
LEDATMVAKAAKKKARAPKRRSRAATAALSDTMKEAVTEVGGPMRTAAQSGFGAAREASGKVTSALPSKRTLKVAVGRALVTGGRALIDPRAAVGEIAVRLGEGLLEDADHLHWFVVRIDDAGRATTYAFIKRADAQAFYDTTRKAFPRQYLCESIAGPGR